MSWLQPWTHDICVFANQPGNLQRLGASSPAVLGAIAPQNTRIPAAKAMSVADIFLEKQQKQREAGGNEPRPRELPSGRRAGST
jgi:hypothetical protein